MYESSGCLVNRETHNLFCLFEQQFIAQLPHYPIPFIVHYVHSELIGPMQTW